MGCADHALARGQVLEMLSHINKRVKDRTGIALPLPELLALFQRPDAPPMVNFRVPF